MFRICHKFLSFMLAVFLLKRKQETSQKVIGSRLKIKMTFRTNCRVLKKLNEDYCVTDFKTWSFFISCLLSGEWWHFRKLRIDCLQNMKKEIEQNSFLRCVPSFFLFVPNLAKPDPVACVLWSSHFGFYQARLSSVRKILSTYIL